MAQYRRPVKVSEQHQKISQRAADIANDAVDQESLNNQLSPAIFQFQRPFRIPDGFGIGLRFWDGVVETLPESDLEILRDIGKKSLRQAIVEQGKLFVGLILGEARNGRNYFDVHR